MSGIKLQIFIALVIFAGECRAQRDRSHQSSAPLKIGEWFLPVFNVCEDVEHVVAYPTHFLFSWFSSRTARFVYFGVSGLFDNENLVFSSSGALFDHFEPEIDEDDMDDDVPSKIQMDVDELMYKYAGQILNAKREHNTRRIEASEWKAPNRFRLQSEEFFRANSRNLATSSRRRVRRHHRSLRANQGEWQ
jgi:hypothetical protein